MEVHAGYLTVKISGRLKAKVLSKHWCILYPGKKTIPPRLDIYADRTKIDPVSAKKSIDIVDAEWQNADTLEPSFCFSARSKRYLFITQTAEDQSTWLKYLCCLCADLCASHKAKSSAGEDDNTVIMQDNCLYASSSDVSLFDVVADPGIGNGVRFGFEGLMKLCFESQSLKLYNMNGERPLAEWSYYSLRNFGHSKHTLFIKTGTKSSTGVGNFSFLTSEGSSMAELIAFYTQRLKEQEKTGTPSPHGDTSVTTGGLMEQKLGLTLSTSLTSSKTKPAPAIPSPKPVSPLPGPSPGSFNAFDAQFKKELNATVAFGHLPLEMKASNGSRRLSNDSIGKKEGEKALSDKKKKKEEKKMAKEREKQEKQNQKKLKKNDKALDDKVKVPKNNSVQEVLENEYSEAYDDNPQNACEDLYSECDFQTRNEEPAKRNVESKVYCDPWRTFSFQIGQENPDNTSNAFLADTEDIYASPIKHGNIVNTIATTEEEQSYEDVGTPSVPNRSQSVGDNDDSNNNVYDHFVASPISQEQQENVYGLDSGTLLNNNVTKKPKKPSLQSDDYEYVQ